MTALPDGAPPPGTVLCRLDEIEDPGSRGFVFGEGEDAFAMFLIHREGRIFGYVNRCPHAGLRLNRRHQFLSRDRKNILCMVHGAKYDVESGNCSGGPCFNLALTPVPVRVEDQTVRIAETANPQE